ncbi:MAG: hypothetical protein ABH829_04830 [archaeon]
MGVPPGETAVGKFFWTAVYLRHDVLRTTDGKTEDAGLWAPLSYRFLRSTPCDVSHKYDSIVKKASAHNIEPTLNQREKLLFDYMEKGEVFVDLGAGYGALLFQAIMHGASRAVGIELNPVGVTTFQSLLRDPGWYLGPKDRDGKWEITNNDLYFKDRKQSEKLLKEGCEFIKKSADKVEMLWGDFLECEIPKGGFIFTGAHLTKDEFRKFFNKIEKETDRCRVAFTTQEDDIEKKYKLDWTLVKKHEMVSGGFFGGRAYLYIFDKN